MEDYLTLNIFTSFFNFIVQLLGKGKQKRRQKGPKVSNFLIMN